MKRQRRFDAIILSSSRFGEIHRSLQLLTDEDEIVRAMAHGAASAKGKLRGKTDPLTRGVCYLYTEPVKGYSKITDFDPVEFYPRLKANLEALYLSHLFAETVIKSLAGGGQGHEVFPLLQETLNEIEASLVPDPGNPKPPQLPRLLAVRFLWRYLGILGVQPGLEECGSCGRSLADTDRRFLTPASGDLVCEACAAEGDLELPAAAVLRILHVADPDTLRRISIDADVLRRTSSVLCSLVEATLGVPLETRRSGRGVLGF